MHIIIVHRIIRKTKDIKLKQNKIYKEKIVWPEVIFRYSYIYLVINSTNFKGKPIMNTLGCFYLFVSKSISLPQNVVISEVLSPNQVNLL